MVQLLFMQAEHFTPAVGTAQRRRERLAALRSDMIDLACELEFNGLEAAAELVCTCCRQLPFQRRVLLMCYATFAYQVPRTLDLNTPGPPARGADEATAAGTIHCAHKVSLMLCCSTLSSPPPATPAPKLPARRAAQWQMQAQLLHRSCTREYQPR